MAKIFFVFVSVICVSVMLACNKTKAVTESASERGKYLVTLGGCHDCHSPKVQGPGGMPLPDTSRLLSGHPEKLLHPVWIPGDPQKNDTLASTNSMMTAWAGPWGISFAINLTPDKETGIGEWSEETFIQAMRIGKHQGQPNGRDILPPMPWFSLKDLKDDDLKAIWAYLRSIPSVKNQAPLPVPPASQPPQAQ